MEKWKKYPKKYPKLKNWNKFIKHSISINFPNNRIEINIPISEGKSRLVISKDALIATGEDNKIVYKVNKGIVKRKRVIIGKSYANQIEIISGLNEHDIIVTKGNENLRNNQPIKVKSHKPWIN